MNDPIIDEVYTILRDGTPEQKAAVRRLIRIANLLTAADKVYLKANFADEIITMTGTLEQFEALLR